MPDFSKMPEAFVSSAEPVWALTELMHSPILMRPMP
jgi:hypothetical protein